MPFIGSIQIVNDPNGGAYAFLADNGRIWKWARNAEAGREGQAHMLDTPSPTGRVSGKQRGNDRILSDYFTTNTALCPTASPESVAQPVLPTSGNAVPPPEIPRSLSRIPEVEEELQRTRSIIKFVGLRYPRLSAARQFSIDELQSPPETAHGHKGTKKSHGCATTGFDKDFDIILTYSEEIKASTCAIKIRQSQGDFLPPSVCEFIDDASHQVTIIDHAVMVKPSRKFDSSAIYSLEIESEASLHQDDHCFAQFSHTETLDSLA